MIKEQILFWVRSWQQNTGDRIKNVLVPSRSSNQLRSSLVGIHPSLCVYPLHCLKDFWWLCVDYLHNKNVYAIGGYLLSENPCPRCFMWDIVSTNSVTEATVLALDKSIHFLIEEVGLRDGDLCFYSSSKEITSWWNQQDKAPWEFRFVFNRL